MNTTYKGRSDQSEIVTEFTSAVDDKKSNKHHEKLQSLNYQSAQKKKLEQDNQYWLEYKHLR